MSYFTHSVVEVWYGRDVLQSVDLAAEMIIKHYLTPVFSTLTGNSALNLLLPFSHFSHFNQVDDVVSVMQWMRKATCTFECLVV